MKKVDLCIPTEDEMDSMTIEELKEWRDKLAPYYYNRFDYDFPERLKTFRYLWFEHMIRNIENGIDRWHRVSVRKRLNDIGIPFNWTVNN